MKIREFKLLTCVIFMGAYLPLGIAAPNLKSCIPLENALQSQLNLMNASDAADLLNYHSLKSEPKDKVLIESIRQNAEKAKANSLFEEIKVLWQVNQAKKFILGNLTFNLAFQALVQLGLVGTTGIHPLLVANDFAITAFMTVAGNLAFLRGNSKSIFPELKNMEKALIKKVDLKKLWADNEETKKNRGFLEKAKGQFTGPFLLTLIFMNLTSSMFDVFMAIPHLDKVSESPEDQKKYLEQKASYNLIYSSGNVFKNFFTISFLFLLKNPIGKFFFRISDRFASDFSYYCGRNLYIDPKFMKDRSKPPAFADEHKENSFQELSPKNASSFSHEILEKQYQLVFTEFKKVFKCSPKKKSLFEEMWENPETTKQAFNKLSAFLEIELSKTQNSATL